MYLRIKKLTFAFLCCLLATGCTTNVFVNEPDTVPDKNQTTNADEVSISFRVSPNSYTRAGEITDEDAVKSLTLAFYKIEGSTWRFIKAERFDNSDSKNDFSTKFDIFNDEIPNAVIAYANINMEDNELNSALPNMPKTIDDFLNNGVNVMSSARYFDGSGTHADVFYTPISESNFSQGDNDGTVVNINLERVGAKVTVSTNGNVWTEIKTLGKDEKVRTLSLTLNGWNVSGTDKSSYVMKQHNLLYNDMQQELGNWVWNKADNKTLSWAHSVNWDKTSNDYPSIGNESESAIANYLTSSDINNIFGSSSLFHETTRSSGVFGTPNARPSVILSGYYTLQGESRPQTLYRQGSKVFTEDELLEYFGKLNNDGLKLYNNQQLQYLPDGMTESYNRKSYDPESVKNKFGTVFGFVKPSNPAYNLPNSVTLQIIANEANRNYLYYGSGPISEEKFPEINKKIAEAIGLWEVYDGGRCFFHIPIEHLGKATDANGGKTGSYGLVRNHHYNITVKSIEGMGIGMPSAGTYIGEWKYPESMSAEKNVKYNVSVNNWTDVSQEINIPKK